MYNISQFKPTLYLLVLLGMTGFALAAQSPAAFVIGCGGVLVNGWLVYSGRFRPMPRLVANLVTIAAMIFVARQLMGAGTSAVLVIGQFLVALQLVKLWEQRANRDYGQLLVLSLLLMVAASINTTSLGFGVMLIAYLFLSLYCCLLFHLKVETDAAKAALPLPEEKVPPATLRQDQRFLAHSMRRLTGIVSGAAVAMAVIVFVLFPRGAGQNVLANMQLAAAQTLTGFRDEVSIDDVTRISQNNAVVAHVELFKTEPFKAEEKTGGAQPLLLRGLTLDTYKADGGRGQWVRSGDQRISNASPNPNLILTSGLSADTPRAHRLGEVQWRQKISLRPTGTRVVFALPTPMNITARRDLKVHYDSDGVLQAEDALNLPLDYEVVSSGVVEEDERWPTRQGPKTVAKAIEEYARKPEVSGTNDKGPLAEQRRNQVTPHALDAQIAANIEQHLKGKDFAYTLDIGEARNRRGQDPYVWFLSEDGKRGHCEYFAGAMALMCQSLGMTARVVVGFRCDEYNDTPGAGYYIVRQSHAHAWVEVLTTDGWQTFDPTNGRDAAAGVHKADWLQRVRHFFDFLEYTYANNVIAYDNENRENLIQTVESKMTSPLYNGINKGYFSHGSLGASIVAKVTESLLHIVVTVALLGGAVFGGWWLYKRWTLRRRVSRIGIESLPPEERLRLARQLGFYDDLIRLLGRHRITRRPHQTPMEFARSLLFLPSDVYETIGRLTELFYKVRFGRTEMTDARQRRLERVLGQVQSSLETAMPGAP